ncbi:hypothetical protein [Vibrio sp. MEBiC08052]|uniref:hypothetical protein n=1 Tax=Vibrio sp. MEBiC08052 TaxID=1761910 RepID=UPI00074071ED|nr:hypothetical protein [Vibrio sp. MEBiC08052]KUI99638.1 hypothetical protein VRK_10840 [Vibrio sp. MEBiC08052]
MPTYIPLNRQFSSVSLASEASEQQEVTFNWWLDETKTWEDLFNEYRCVILSEAGSGKTEEFQQQAMFLQQQGRPAFFIRIEDIDRDFPAAFEIGDEDLFHSWLASSDDAWFFLDSVDEARLGNPQDFAKAIRYFSRTIQPATQRAHIYISSRPYCWRSDDDPQLLNHHLFLPRPQNDADELLDDDEPNSEKSGNDQQESALNIYGLRPLNVDRIREFCEVRRAEDIDDLMNEIERLSLWSLAERPFDLELILSKWSGDKTLGCRLDLLRYHIERQLKDAHDVDRSERQPLNSARAKEGAQRLAAAVILTGKAGINVPDSGNALLPDKPGIDAEEILYDWKSGEIRTLLERALFNDVIYGAVRLRHRDIRELLAAEWIAQLLKSDIERFQIESLFFRDSFGERIITPRLRPILPWLVLFDDEIRHKVQDINPGVILADGDPSRLPFSVRQKILTDVVRDIATDRDDRAARDNSAIAKIAHSDLSADVLRLIGEYQHNEDAIFFLGRLVWQGKMSTCIESLMPVAVNPDAGKYARIAAIRAVMTSGRTEQQADIWQSIIDANSAIPKQIFTELIKDSQPSKNIIQLVLQAVPLLFPCNIFESGSVIRALHDFVGRTSVDILPDFLKGLSQYLDTEPYIERHSCYVSKQYAQLMNIALHIVELLIKTRHQFVFTDVVFSILMNSVALKYWQDGGYDRYQHQLNNLVPAWHELNDALYWRCIERERVYKQQEKSVTDDWSITYLDHFWRFTLTDFDRLLTYIDTRPLADDHLVVLNRAYRIYCEAEQPDDLLQRLKVVVQGKELLDQQLSTLLNPSVCESTLAYEQQQIEWEQQDEQEKRQREQNRLEWLTSLRHDPDLIKYPANIRHGEITNNHVRRLMEDLEIDRSPTSRECFCLWKELIPEFGQEVAQAYRDFAVQHWRYYHPKLRSEEEIDNSIPYALLLAMAGLEIEAAEAQDFPSYLTEDEVRHALRYLTWDINGFPTWFEKFHHCFPTLVEEAVWKEMCWELDNTTSEQSGHIVHDLVYYEPWIHVHLTSRILEWLLSADSVDKTMGGYCLKILSHADVDPAMISAIAQKQIHSSQSDKEVAWWYAMLVDSTPNVGIPQLEGWLRHLDEDVAKEVAQTFIVTLLGEDRDSSGGVGLTRFHTPQHLKSLYMLMHQYIQTSEDIDRTNGGIYSPKMRDYAQRARDHLFSSLITIPGKETYCVVRELMKEHPDPEHRPWMRKCAYRLAEQSGDLEPWSTAQVREFHQSQSISPDSHRQLFELSVQRIRQLKHWLERGNHSPWKTWQKVQEENEMRTLIAGWLNQTSQGKYTIAEEPELANQQRMDIWLAHPRVTSPVPIELKLLDKKWSGSDLCERLRNQLAGDYLREQTAGCGLFLLVSQNTDRRWRINNRNVGLDKLAQSLKDYWQTISHEFLNVEAIEVVVIDLAARSRVSDT